MGTVFPRERKVPLKCQTILRTSWHSDTPCVRAIGQRCQNFWMHSNAGPNCLQVLIMDTNALVSCSTLIFTFFQSGNLPKIHPHRDGVSLQGKQQDPLRWQLLQCQRGVLLCIPWKFKIACGASGI